jgi:hypothetical protein
MKSAALPFRGLSHQVFKEQPVTLRKCDGETSESVTSKFCVCPSLSLSTDSWIDANSLFGYDTIRVHLRYISQIFRTRKRSRWVGVHKNHYFALMVSAMLALFPCCRVLMRCVKTEHMMLIPVPCPAILVAFPFLSAGLGESRPTNLCPTTVRYIITELAHVQGTTLSRVLS